MLPRGDAPKAGFSYSEMDSILQDYLCESERWWKGRGHSKRIHRELWFLLQLQLQT